MESIAAPSISLFGYIIPFLIVLTVVVFFHELGHFLVGRWNGVRVEAFSVGFGPEIFGFTDHHGTRWKFSIIPLGGYVKFFGDSDAASSPDFDAAASISDSERTQSFVHKRVGQRAAVVAAGPIANFILAIVIFTVSFMVFGRYISEPVISEVFPDSPAAEAGLMPRDVILTIDGDRIESFNDVVRIIAPNPGREVNIVVRRDGEQVSVPLTPERTEREDRFGNVNEYGMIGIANEPQETNGRIETAGPVEAFGLAVGETWFITKSTILYLKEIIVGNQSADQLGGPIRIAKVSGEVATVGISALVNLAAVLSVSIGLLNLFPIPMLDGGHLVFYAIEAIRGRPLGERAQEIGFRIGLSLVLMLMIFATWNDVSQIFLAG